MPDKKRYDREKKIRELYHKDITGNQTYSEFRKALKKLKKDNLI